MIKGVLFQMDNRKDGSQEWEGEPGTVMGAC